LHTPAAGSALPTSSVAHLRDNVTGAALTLSQDDLT
jgi:hypothetical protein